MALFPHSVPWIQNLWQLKSCDNHDHLHSCSKSIRGYAKHIYKINEIIKKLSYYLRKGTFKNLQSILHIIIKIAHFLFPLTSKKFRDNFKFQQFLSSTSF